MKKRKISWLLLAVLALAFFLRFYHLGSRPLYGDEPYNTVTVAAKPISFIISTNYGSILYSLLLHFLLPLGKTEFMARLPAAVFGFLSVWLVFLIGRIVFSKREAILAALLSALSTSFIYFSQQARGYTGLLFFSLCSYYFFLSALRKNRPLNWAAYALFTAIAVYMHFFALIIIPVQLFIFILNLLEHGFVKGRIKEFFGAGKTSLPFFLSLLLIMVLVFLLYSPAKNQQAGENLFLMFPHSFTSLFKGQMSMAPRSLVSELLKRQLDYDVSPAFFYTQLAFVFLGILAALKNKRRDLIFLLSCVLLPLALFIFSNPPANYLPVDNKFLLILPPLFLLMANGVTGLASVLARGLSKAMRQKNPAGLEPRIFSFLIILIILGESAYFFNIFPGWKLKYLERGTEISAYLNEHAVNGEMLLSDSPAALWNFLSVISVAYPEGGKKILFIKESGDKIPKSAAFDPGGLWILLNPSPLEDKTVSKWKLCSGEMDVHPFSRGTLIHFSGQEPLWEKMALAAKLLLEQPNKKIDETSHHLFLTKIFLLAGKNQEALRELDVLKQMKNGPPAGKLREILQDALDDNVFELLLENGAQALLDGHEEEAFSLWTKAGSLRFSSMESQRRIYFAQAESLMQKGRRNEAKLKYQQTLLLCRNRKEEDYVITRIGELLSLPCGYLIWRKDDLWHLRWWSEQRKKFSGKITAFPPFLKLKKSSLKGEDSFVSSKGELTFRGFSKNGYIKGFDIRIQALSKLACLLKIDGDENILGKIVIAGKNEHPGRMPFSLD